MFDLSHSLFILTLLQLMLPVAAGVSVGRGMGIKDSHIKKGTFKTTTPKAISSNIQPCTILSV